MKIEKIACPRLNYYSAFTKSSFESIAAAAPRAEVFVGFNDVIDPIPISIMCGKYNEDNLTCAISQKKEGGIDTYHPCIYSKWKKFPSEGSPEKK